MRSILFFLGLIIFVPSSANAEHFSCNLNLNLIENTNSSEDKKLTFDIEFEPGSEENNMIGAMITTSCFNKITDAFTSKATKLEIVANDGTIQGTMKNLNIIIANYTYQLDLIFTELAGLNKFSNNSFTATGKLLSSDNIHFIHQNIEGECQLSREEGDLNHIFLPSDEENLCY